MFTIAAGVCLGIVAAWFLWQMLGFVIGVTVALQEWQDKGALRGVTAILGSILACVVTGLLTVSSIISEGTTREKLRWLGFHNRPSLALAIVCIFDRATQSPSSVASVQRRDSAR